MMNVEKIANAVNFSRKTVGERMSKVFYLREEHKKKVPTKAELMTRFTEKVEKAETFDFDKLVKEFKKENRKDLHLAKWGCRRNRIIDNHEGAIQAVKDFLLNECPKGEFLIQSAIADSFQYYDILDDGGFEWDFEVGIDNFARIVGALEAALNDLEKEGKVKREVRKCQCRQVWSCGNHSYKKCFMVLD